MDISKIEKRRFTYKDILDLEPSMGYEALAEEIGRLCEGGQIAPIKSGGKTSFAPAIYTEYRKLKSKEDYSGYEAEIKAIHPRLSISRYLSNPEEYTECRGGILKLSEFLWREDIRLEQKMSVKEKSYAIWEDEKFLEQKAGRRILSFNKISETDLNYYYAPEPFFCSRTGKPGVALVIENKDPWYSIGKALKQTGTGRFCGVPVSMLIYGEGTKITGRNVLTGFLEDEGHLPCPVYYAGDMDVAGVRLLYEADRCNPKIEIMPFRSLYLAMAKKGRLQMEAGRELELTEDRRAASWDRRFLTLFPEEYQHAVQEILEEKRRIPQEILGLPDYLDMCCVKV